MTALPHRLDRSIVIRASQETVFGFFIDDRRWASWWGAGSSIDARAGGRVLIRHPDGTEALGEVLDLRAPDLRVFSLGYPSRPSMPPGSSKVTITVAETENGTRLQLTHEFANVEARDEHVQGWRYQLALFANLVADEVCANAPAAIDQWFAAWSEPDPVARQGQLSAIAREDVRFSDRYSLVEGIADLVPHLTAAQHFMPGLRLQRTGEIRQCQGTALADWEAVATDGKVRATGTNVFVFDAAGTIETATGFWGAAK